ncbi:hypothetical protein [Brevibacillus choshinensis]|uniref:hypothetical protein n=1 Tax=Brevibacillus choshinensis TaxID=54911 RepID=UPI002E24F8A4|nr:hypothetical protein [Brevibacillus choshinensis]
MSDQNQDMNWVDVEKYYPGTPFEIKKGNRFSLLLTFQNPLEKEDELVLPSFLSEWTYGEDRFIKLFKLLKCDMGLRTVYVEYEIVRKNRNLDEIKLLLIDFLAAYEVSGNPIVDVKVEQLAG